MKKKKEIEIIFNPTDYAYMDEMILEGWLWEFERRSDAYKEAYSSYEKIFFNDHNIALVAIGKKLYAKKIPIKKAEEEKKKAEEQCDKKWNKYVKENPLVNELMFFESCFFDPSKNWSEVDQVSTGLSRANPVKVINMKWGNKLPPPSKVYYVKINGKDFPFDTTKKPEPFTKADVKVKGGKVILTYDYNNRYPLDLLRKQIGKENILMALIDISASNKEKDILQTLDSLIDKWKKDLKIKTAKSLRKQHETDRRKSWLMVYDLKTANKKLSYTDIGNKLYRHFENNHEFTLPRNIGNYFKEAEKMIDGGYKNLL